MAQPATRISSRWRSSRGRDPPANHKNQAPCRGDIPPRPPPPNPNPARPRRGDLPGRPQIPFAAPATQTSPHCHGGTEGDASMADVRATQSLAPTENTMLRFAGDMIFRPYRSRLWRMAEAPAGGGRYSSLSSLSQPKGLVQGSGLRGVMVPLSELSWPPSPPTGKLSPPAPPLPFAPPLPPPFAKWCAWK